MARRRSASAAAGVSEHIDAAFKEARAYKLNTACFGRSPDALLKAFGNPHSTPAHSVVRAAAGIASVTNYRMNTPVCKPIYI